jgi:hypothetical protein
MGNYQNTTGPRMGETEFPNKTLAHLKESEALVEGGFRPSFDS